MAHSKKYKSQINSIIYISTHCRYKCKKILIVAVHQAPAENY